MGSRTRSYTSELVFQNRKAANSKQAFTFSCVTQHCLGYVRKVSATRDFFTSIHSHYMFTRVAYLFLSFFFWARFSWFACRFHSAADAHVRQVFSTCSQAFVFPSSISNCIFDGDEGKLFPFQDSMMSSPNSEYWQLDKLPSPYSYCITRKASEPMFYKFIFS